MRAAQRCFHAWRERAVSERRSSHSLKSPGEIVRAAAEFEKAIASGPAVVDYYASWCGKCRQVRTGLCPAHPMLVPAHAPMSLTDVNRSLLPHSILQIAPYVDELIQTHPSVKFFKVDTDDKNLVDMVKGVPWQPLFLSTLRRLLPHT